MLEIFEDIKDEFFKALSDNITTEEFINKVILILYNYKNR